MKGQFPKVQSLAKIFLIYLWVLAAVPNVLGLFITVSGERGDTDVSVTSRAVESSLSETSHAHDQGTQVAGHSHNAEAAQRIGRDTPEGTTLDENEEDELDGDAWRLRKQIEELTRELSGAKQALKEKSKSEKLLLEQIARFTEERKNQDRNRLDLEAQLTQVRAELAELQARPPPEPDLTRLELVAVVRAKAHYRAKQLFDVLERCGVLEHVRAGRRLMARISRRSSRGYRVVKKKLKPYMKHFRRSSRRISHIMVQRARFIMAKVQPSMNRLAIRFWTALAITMDRMLRYVPPSQRHRIWNIYQAASARLYEYGQCYGKQLKYAQRGQTNGSTGMYSIAFERAVAFKENARIAVWCFWQADSTSRVVLMSTAWVFMVLVWVGAGVTLLFARLMSKTWRALHSTS
jgi:hypothetical protein